MISDAAREVEYALKLTKRFFLILVEVDTSRERSRLASLLREIPDPLTSICGACYYASFGCAGIEHRNFATY
jgi:hypothetical protein